MSCEFCYNCGSTENLTNDHIPPKGFFPPPRPTDLITVKCCVRCNNSFSTDDEAFRLWVTSARGCSEAGTWIWTHKVAPNSIEAKPRLKAKMAQLLHTLTLDTPSGTIVTPALGFPQIRAKRFLSRITKGLIVRFYPHLHDRLNRFRVYQILPKPESIGIVRQLIPLMAYDERGNGVFRFYRGVPVDAQQNSAWIFFFYDDAAFLVLQAKWPSRPVIL